MAIFSQLLQPIFVIFFPRAVLTLCWTMLFVQLELVEYLSIYLSGWRCRGRTTTIYAKFLTLWSFKNTFQSHRADFGVALLLLIVDGLNSFGLVFVCCELCQRLSDAFNEFDDIIDQQTWYLFPNKLKQILPTIMIISHEPVTIECFGSISCNRDVFKKARKITINSFLCYVLPFWCVCLCG